MPDMGGHFRGAFRKLGETGGTLLPVGKQRAVERHGLTPSSGRGAVGGSREAQLVIVDDCDG